LQLDADKQLRVAHGAFGRQSDASAAQHDAAAGVVGPTPGEAIGKGDEQGSHDRVLPGDLGVGGFAQLLNRKSGKLVAGGQHEPRGGRIKRSRRWMMVGPRALKLA
jgi:hypothetical protein